MTATVIDLASRRRPQVTATLSCSACRRDADGGTRECYPHRLDSLARRLAFVSEATADELLVTRETFAATITEVLTVLDGITSECLTAEERDAR